MATPVKTRRAAPWTAAERKQLGKLPDSVLARRTGRFIKEVVAERERQRIRLPTGPRRWTAREIRLLGRFNDYEVARRLGRNVNGVRVQRIALGIPPIADPRLWAIHPRLRSQREGGDKAARVKKGKGKHDSATSTTDTRLLTREKRKYGETGKPLVLLRPTDAKPDDTKQPNFFADFAGLKAFADEFGKKNRDQTWLTKEWTSAEITGEGGAPPLIHGKSFWGCVKAAQWERVRAINEARLGEWRNKLNSMPE